MSVVWVSRNILIMLDLINFCTLYAKYFIYTNQIKGNNNFEFLGYLTYLKYVLNF